MQPQQQQQNMRFWLVLLIIAAALGCIYFYVIPFLGAVGKSNNSGYSDEQTEAYQLAQSVQTYRKKHPSPGNYAQVAIRQSYDDDTFSKWDSSDVYEGFDDVNGENSTHSEQLAHTWILDTISIYQKGTNWKHVKSLTIVFYSQVQVCKSCRIDMRSWLNTYQKEARKPITTSIWEHAHFFIKKPSTGAVMSEDDVIQVNIKWDPTSTSS